jgi:hypothetical protein
MVYDWAPDMLAGLARLGVIPTPASAPAPVKDYVSQLYRYELRRLRARLVRGQIARPAYAGLVAALRPRYWMLSRPAADWARPRS